MRNRVLYLNPNRVEKQLDHLARYVSRVKRGCRDQAKFVRDYFEFRRMGKNHAEAVSNARNAV